MSRKKCMQCKEWITETEINADIGKKQCHFCSEKCKNLAVKEQEEKEKKAANKDRVYKLICDILGVREIINTALWKEHEVWLKVADDEKIGKYLEENKGYLTQSISRLSSSEYAKIRYLSTILKNSLGDWKSKVEEKNEPIIVQTTVEVYEIKHISNNKRVSLVDLEDCF